LFASPYTLEAGIKIHTVAVGVTVGVGDTVGVGVGSAEAGCTKIRRVKQNAKARTAAPKISFFFTALSPAKRFKTSAALPAKSI